MPGPEDRDIPEAIAYMKKLRPAWEEVKVLKLKDGLQIRAKVNGRHRDNAAEINDRTPWKLAVLTAVMGIQGAGCCG